MCHVHTLCPAGFGLDFVWPYLADYPEDKVAVIDDTCVMRPTHVLGPSPLTKVLLWPPCLIGCQHFFVRMVLSVLCHLWFAC